MGFFDGLLGGVGGFLAGGPLGAGLGFLGGAFGGDDARRTTTRPRPWSASERRLLDSLYPAIQGATTAPRTGALARRFFGEINPAIMGDIDETFRRAGGDLALRQAYTGTGPSSTAAYRQAMLAGEHGRARASGRATARTTAEQLALGRENANLARLSGLTGVLGTLYGSGQETTTAIPNRGLTEGLSLGGYGLTSPFSYYNRMGGLGGIFDNYFGGI